MDKYSRKDLIEICEKAVVEHTQWANRDSSNVQRKIGHCWALLKANCDFKIVTATDNKYICIDVTFDSFMTFEGQGPETQRFYLPTRQTLETCNGIDWY